MTQFGAPNFLGMIDAYEAGARRRERSRLQELAERGRELQGMALQGDQNALAELGRMNPEAYMQTQQFTNEQNKQFVQDFTRQAYAANTPEKWKSMIDIYKAQGRSFDPGEDAFENRDALIARGLDVGDMMGLDLRRQEAARSQANVDRSYALDVRQFEASEARANRDNDPYGERANAATQYGLQPGTPEYQTFVLTGKTPNEQRSTAQDRAAIREADDMAFAAQNAIWQLQEALALNEKAGSGYFADAQSFAARNDPTGMIFDQEQGKATTEFRNLVLNQALGQLKAIFGTAPTEGERAILVDLQASVDKSPAERKAILDRAIALTQRRRDFQRDRGNELRSGTYYQPRSGPNGGEGAPRGGGQPQGAGVVDADALIEQANDAIQRGADPAAVQRRLREQGVEADFGE